MVTSVSEAAYVSFPPIGNIRSGETSEQANNLMAGKLGLGVAILVLCGVLWLALRTGDMAAGGSTVYRDKTPVQFWTFFGFACFVLVVLIALLLLT